MKLSDTQLQSALKLYGHSFARLDFMQSGYRNTSHIIETSSGMICNLLVYKREDNIEDLIRRINSFSDHLHEVGLPVRHPLDDRILQMKAVNGYRYASLYSFEHGSTIAWEMYTMKHIKLLGMAMGNLHVLARTYDGELPSVSDEYRRIIGRMDRYFADKQIVQAIQDKLSLALTMSITNLGKILDDVNSLAGQQPLHMDLVRGNVLFRKAEDADRFVVDGLALSGILDLERAAYGHPLFDLGRTYAFLLVDCNKTAEKIYKYFIRSGYFKRGGGEVRLFSDVSTAEIFDSLVTLFLAYDFYKFLRQNPYESLQDNYHFLRTRDILIERKVVQLT